MVVWWLYFMNLLSNVFGQKIFINTFSRLHYGKKCSKIGKNLTNFKKVSDPNLGHLEWFQRWLCLKITFGMLFFIVWAIENKKKIQKKFILQFLISADISIFHPETDTLHLHNMLPILGPSRSRYETNTQSWAYMWVKLGYWSWVHLSPPLSPTRPRLWL